MKNWILIATLTILCFSNFVFSQQLQKGYKQTPRLTTDDLNGSRGSSKASANSDTDSSLPDASNVGGEPGRDKDISQDLRQSNNPKLRELASLPVGLIVNHYPNPTEARAVNEGHWPYIWPYMTTIQATRGVIRIEEFGTFAWRDGIWDFSTVTGKPYSAKDFREWYHCPNGAVSSESHCADLRNWTGRANLEDSQTLWYFIGVDEKGKRVKGLAIVKHLGSLR